MSNLGMKKAEKKVSALLKAAVASIDPPRPSEMARRCNVSHQRITNAIRRGQVSTDLAPLLEKATEGKFKKAWFVWPEDAEAA